MTKIITYNVNGIRSAISKGLIDWVKAVNADILCFQEVKALEDQANLQAFQAMGYQIFWHAASKKGYSGVAILSRKTPVEFCMGCGIERYDLEGRIMRLDFETFSVINVYMPSGSSGELRQAFKTVWLEDFFNYIQELKKSIPNLVICGDFNICHQSIDIHNPRSNANSSGFLPEERSWMTKFFNTGFIDVFRFFNAEPHKYTWWSYRANARTKNLGWRIDYQVVSDSLKPKLHRSVILQEARHSDHCPVLLELSV